MAPLISNGVYKIRNGEFTRLVADLIDGVPHGPIKAYVEHPYNRNDRWRVKNVGSGGNQITLQSVSTPESFATADEFPGASLVGSGERIEWTVVKVDGGRYMIQSPDSVFVWELPRGVEYEPIVLEYHSGRDNQKWLFRRLSD